MKKFDKKLIDTARREFAAVYVDKATPTEYRGSLTGYTGDRVRIYQTSWEYEEADIIRNNFDLAAYLAEYFYNEYGGIYEALC